MSGLSNPGRTIAFQNLSKGPSIFRHLIVAHNHLRPGGVRRIIELALPYLISGPGASISSVTLAVGDADAADWLEELSLALPGVRLGLFHEPAFRYVSEQQSSPALTRRRIRSALERLVPPARASETILWLQNPGLARNVILVEELAKFSQRRSIPLVAHHHDFWFENRWRRWPEMRASGYRTTAAVARAVFAAGAPACHVAINRLDHSVLRKHLDARWLPNLSGATQPPGALDIAAARRWLAESLGDRAPVWIFPTRFLRRKNLAEAILLTRWLCPEGWFVTTAGVSSSDEAPYARRLEEAARDGGGERDFVSWRRRRSGRPVRAQFLDGG